MRRILLFASCLLLPTLTTASYHGGVRIGYLFPLSTSYDNSEKMLTLEGSAIYDAGSFIVQILHGQSWSETCTEYRMVEFSFIKPLSCNEISPYLGSGIAIHRIATSSESNDGFGFSVNTGIIALRRQDVRVVLEVKYASALVPIGSRESQQAITLTLGVSYKAGGLLHF